VSPVKYEIGFYMPEDDILHSYRCENLKSYMLHILIVILISLIHTLRSIIKNICRSTVLSFVI
jgi:hypothetical protein